MDLHRMEIGCMERGKGSPDAAGSPRNFFRNSELGELFRVGVAIPLRIHLTRAILNLKFILFKLSSVF